MNVLLDTCTFLWLVTGDEALSDAAADAIRDPANEVWLSAVSAWEIAVKHRIGRLPLPEPPDRLVPRLRDEHRVRALALDEEGALGEARLPPVHTDPFDRMLVAQAITRGMVIWTPDEQIRRYPVRTRW